MEMSSISSFLLLLYILALSTTFHLCSSRLISPIHTTNSPTTSKGGSRIVLPLFGNVEPKGYFSADFKIGQPEKIFDLHVDTGSHLTWVQCDAPCEAGCTKPKNEQYKPKEENWVRCGDPICESVTQKRCNDPNDKCNYELRYIDGSNTTGFLVRDNFQLQFTNGTGISPRLVFGCGYKQYHPVIDPSKETGGLLGFSDGKESILSQLRDMGFIKNVGGHCLRSLIGGGFIFLGDVPDAYSNSVAWVPRKLDTKLEKKLYITAPVELFHDRSPVTGTAGMELNFDSGSTYTVLSKTQYNTMVTQIKKDVMRWKSMVFVKPGPKESDQVCWKSNTKKPFRTISVAKTFFKPFMLKFANNKELQIPPEAYIFIDEHGYVCLGLDETDEVNNTVIVGDISMQNTMMIFDNEKKEVGWVSSANCADIPKS